MDFILTFKLFKFPLFTQLDKIYKLDTKVDFIVAYLLRQFKINPQSFHRMASNSLSLEIDLQLPCIDVFWKAQKIIKADFIFGKIIKAFYYYFF